MILAIYDFQMRRRIKIRTGTLKSPQPELPTENVRTGFSELDPMAQRAELSAAVQKAELDSSMQRVEIQG
jgi:hypothetical protein